MYYVFVMIQFFLTSDISPNAVSNKALMISIVTSAVVSEMESSALTERLGVRMRIRLAASTFANVLISPHERASLTP